MPKSKNRNKIILNLGSPCSKWLFSNRRAERANLNVQGSLKTFELFSFQVALLILFVVKELPFHLHGQTNEVHAKLDSLAHVGQIRR